MLETVKHEGASFLQLAQGCWARNATWTCQEGCHQQHGRGKPQRWCFIKWDLHQVTWKLDQSFTMINQHLLLANVLIHRNKPSMQFCHIYATTIHTLTQSRTHTYLNYPTSDILRLFHIVHTIACLIAFPFIPMSPSEYYPISSPALR